MLRAEQLAVTDQLRFARELPPFARHKLRHGGLQDPTHERAFSRAGNAADHAQPPDGKAHIDILEVVQIRALQLQPPVHILQRTPGAADRVFQRLAQKAAGRRGLDKLDFRERALRDDLTTARSRAGAEVDDRVGAAHGVLVVLHDDHGVALALERFERVEQRGVVACVQADGRLVEHIEHAAKIRAELRGEADALALAAAQRLGRAIEREVVEPHRAHEIQPLLDLRKDVLGDGLLLFGKLEFAQQLQRAADRQLGTFVNRPSEHAHVPRDAIQPRAGANRARLRLAFLQSLVLSFLRDFDLDRRLQLRIDRRLPHFAEALALLAPAVRGVEREQPRIELLEGFAARRAAHLGAEHGRALLLVHELRRAVADLHRALHDFPHRLRFRTFADEHVDGVLAKAFELRERLDWIKFAVDQQLLETLAQRPLADLGMETFARLDRRAFASPRRGRISGKTACRVSRTSAAGSDRPRSRSRRWIFRRRA